MAMAPIRMISEKTRIPAIREHVVVRDRLETRLGQALDARLTIVAAPAGFGKTIAIGEWILRNNHRAAWLTLEEGDDARLWHYLVFAVDRAFSGFAERMRSVLDDGAVSAEFPVACLIRELSRCAEPLFLVLDDYHLIRDPAVHDSVRFFAENAPDTVRVVLIGQKPPPFPLSRLRMAGRLCEIGMEDLRFSPGETAELVEKSARRRLPASDIDLLCSKTEGWPVGVRIASIYLRDREDSSRVIRDFSGSHRLVVDYVVDVLLDRQPEHVRKILLYTSVLDRFCASLARAVAEIGPSRQLPVDAELTRFFVIPLDPEHAWFRYHSLFAECLRQLLARYASPDEIRRAHLRAARWFAENRMFKEAIAHARAAGDDGLAVDYAARLYELSPRDAQRLIFESWFMDIPVRLWLRHPKVYIHLASSLILFGKRAEALRFLDEAKALIGKHPRPDAADIPEDALATVRESLPVLRGGYLAGPDEKNLPEYIEDVIKLVEWSGRHVDFWNRGDVRLARSYVAFGGKIRTSLELYTRLNADPRKAIFFHEYLEGYGEVVIAELFYELDDLENAERVLAHAMPAVTASDKAALLVAAHYLKARLEYAKGRPEAAMEALREADRRLSGLDSPRWKSNLEAITVGFLLRRGAAEKGVRWAERRLMDVSGQPSLADEFEHFIFARVLMAQGRTEDAIHWLMKLFERAKASRRIGSEIEALLLLAMCWMRSGDAEHALGALDDALAEAEAHGHVRAFLDEGGAMADLLSLWLREAENGPRPEAVRRRMRFAADLLRRFERDHAAQAAAALKAPPAAAALLIRREYEALLMIADGATNEDIAGKLGLSVGTVKRYTHNLFQKLEARNRVEAVAKAKRLGII